MTTETLVVDLSHWNPTPDWNRLKAGGIVGVIHKCTESTSYVDDTWKERISDAMAAGLKVATYHFMRPSDIGEQMAHYISEQDKVMPLGSRVCLDHEDEKVSLDALKEAVRQIRSKRPDLQIAIYSGHLIKQQLGDECDALLADTTSLWIAQYTTASKPSWPKKTWPQWSLWQWTDSATVDGISAPVDGNRWNGSQKNLLEWFGPAGEPQPQPQPQTQDIVLTVPKGMRVIVNDVVVET
jgi:lysozyme